MIVRSIDLTSNDLVVGDRVDIMIGEADLRSGEDGSIRMTMIAGKPVGDLSVRSLIGFSSSRLEMSSTEEGCEGTLNLVANGDPGDARIEITLRTGDVGATAGTALMETRIGEGSMGIELSEIPVHWNGNEPISIPLILSSRSKVKGRLVALLKDTGDTLLNTSVSFKGEHHLSILLDPSKAHDLERMDILVRFTSGDRKEEVLFDGAVLLDRIPDDPNPIPEMLTAGGEMDIGSMGNGFTSATLTAEKDRTVLKAIEGREGKWVRIPEEARGEYTLELEGPHGRMMKKISIDPIPPFQHLSVTAEKESVMSGDELDLMVHFEPNETSDQELRIRIGHDRRMFLRAHLDGQRTRMRCSLSVPPDHPPGPQPAIIEVFKDGGSVHREVVAGFINIISSLSLPVALELPERGKHQYLFPGESVRVEGSLGPLRCLELTSGRRLLALEGSTLWGIGWKEEDTERTLELYLEFLYRDALRDMERARSIRQGALRQMACAEEAISSRPTPNGEAPIVSCSFRSMASGKDPNELSKAIASFNGSLLSGRSLLEGFDARNSARELVESVVRSLKGYRSSSTTHTIAAIRDAAKGIEDALRELRSVPEDPRGLITKTLDLLVHGSLLQIELSSVWTDPAISSWDDLRTLRQRYIKRSIQCALDGLEALASIHARAGGRIRSLRNNMEVRRALSSTREIILKGTPLLKATGTGSLKGEIEIVPGPLKVESDVYVLNPSPSWQLISPLSTRDRTGHFIGRYELDRGHPLRIELELIPPQGSFTGSPAIFIRPSRYYLEEEP
ncbi:MAG: hypothetical protein QCI82_11290 [Candidatus Thermoplasmatota archaeon]|nr:hypothetical protein [Candidatus Thermoplasmatota archaeon]